MDKVKVILVLGCVRSGTSCLAGMLADQGVSSGSSYKKSKPNTPKGSYEDSRITKFHHDLFHWFSPQECSWGKSEKEIAGRILTSYRGKYPILIKDPKMLIVIEEWLNLINPVLLGTFRNPTLVVDSMLRRVEYNKYYPYPKKVVGWKPITRAWGYKIWEEYNSRLLKLHDRFKFPIVNFDSLAYEKDVRQACEKIGIHSQKRFTMFEEKFRHLKPRDPSEKSLNILMELYKKLKRISL